ncbi:hypothetical protein EV424DRAFT_1348127 [Suillus variegatus]|nr:hypothetical protein EV424DRAFT_1348127 [Suillus variegatus]
MSTLIEIISLCNRVTRITLVLSTKEFNVDGSALWHALDALPLQSLVLALDVKLPPPISTFNMFNNLSHLDVNDKSFLNQPTTELGSFQALTHLSVVFIHERTDPLAITQIISNQRLRVLAFRVEVDHYLVEGFLEHHGIRDGRIVLFPIELNNWGRLGQGDMLMWELAEEQVKLPMAVYERHRCVSHSRIQNICADYNDVKRRPEWNPYCTQWTRAATGGTTGMARTKRLGV